MKYNLSFYFFALIFSSYVSADQFVYDLFAKNVGTFEGVQDKARNGSTDNPCSLTVSEGSDGTYFNVNVESSNFNPLPMGYRASLSTTDSLLVQLKEELYQGRNLLYFYDYVEGSMGGGISYSNPFQSAPVYKLRVHFNSKNLSLTHYEYFIDDWFYFKCKL
jgi:hypothetical protein